MTNAKYKRLVRISERKGWSSEHERFAVEDQVRRYRSGSLHCKNGKSKPHSSGANA